MELLIIQINVWDLQEITRTLIIPLRYYHPAEFFFFSGEDIKLLASFINQNTKECTA